MKKHAKTALLAALPAAVLLFFLFIPCRKEVSPDGLKAHLPQESFLSGIHCNIGPTAKWQLLDTPLESILRSFGFNPYRLAKHPAFLWTRRLAVGRHLATSLSFDGNGQIVLSAASDIGIKRHLARLLLLIRYIPGLGRLETNAFGRKYAALKGDRPLYLVFDMTGSVLSIKCAANPDLPASKNDGPGTVGATECPRNAPLHKFTLKRHYAEDHFFRGLDADVIVAITPQKDEIGILASFSPDKETAKALSPLAKEKVRGLNGKAEALPTSSAPVVLLLPGAFVSRLAIGHAGCEKSSSSAEDAIFFLSTGQYGGRILFLEIPAVTAVVPGVTANVQSLKSTLLGNLPKLLKNQFAVTGGNVISSSKSALKEQIASNGDPRPLWRTIYAKRASRQTPCAYLYVDIDSAIRETMRLLSSYGKIKNLGFIPPGNPIDGKIAPIARNLPCSGTSLFLSALLLPGEDGKIDLDLSLLPRSAIRD